MNLQWSKQGCNIIRRSALRSQPLRNAFHAFRSRCLSARLSKKEGPANPYQECRVSVSRLICLRSRRMRATCRSRQANESFVLATGLFAQLGRHGGSATMHCLSKPGRSYSSPRFLARLWLLFRRRLCPLSRHILQGISYLPVTLRISRLARDLSHSQYGQQHMHTGLLSAYTSSFVYKQQTGSILVCGMVCRFRSVIISSLRTNRWVRQC